MVVDDASTDGTPEIVRALAPSLGFPVRLIELETRGGAPAAFGRGLSEATGDVVAFADQDDVWYRNRLAVGWRRLSELPVPGLVFASPDIVDERLRPMGFRTMSGGARERFRDRDPFGSLLRANAATGMTMLFDRELASTVLPIPEGWLHDSWIAIVAAATGYVDVVDEPLVAYRQHSSNQVGATMGTVDRLRLEYIRRKDYHRRIAGRIASLEERLAELPAVDPDRLGVLGRYSEHYQWRATQPPDRWSRAAVVMRHALRGDYRDLGYGYRGVIRDLIWSYPAPTPAAA